MAKFKPVRPKAKGKAPQTRGAIPCIIFLILGMSFLILLFYAILKPS